MTQTDLSTLLSTLSLQQKIAQMLMMGFQGSEITPENPIYSEILELEIGGIVLFDKDMVGHTAVRNIESPAQVKKLTETAQQLSDIPLFVGIDQEGGMVARLRKETGFMEFPSHKTLGRFKDTEQVAFISAMHAMMLQEHGINMNFAPCVDLAINEDSPIIDGKERAFSKDPELVSTLAIAYAQAQQELEVIGCPKHFPGHGSAAADSHKGICDISETWSEEELIPYQRLIEANLAPIVMIGHLMLKQLDPDLPSSISKKTIDELLIQKLGYDGVVITDDLQMRAISSFYTMEEYIPICINAGCDILLFGNNLLPERVDASYLLKLIEKSVLEGTISEERIDAACTKILRLKKNFNFF